MRTKSENETERDPEIVRKYALELMLSIADVTWRMFIGPAVLVSAGLYADIKYGTKPLMTLVGLALGLVISVLLVRAQLRGVR